MTGVRRLARDTALLTGASLLMRCIGLAYQVWLAGRIGAAGIGLWQLVMSVTALSATLAISGIRFTTTRLLAEEHGQGGRAMDAAVAHCLRYAAVFGCGAFVLLFLAAEPIGFLWVGDARTVRSLRLLAFTMPLLALSCVLNGYFVAVGKAWKSAAVQVAEQLFGVGLIMLLLRPVPEGELEQSCAAIARGNLGADALSLALVALLYLTDRDRRGGTPSPGLAGRMLRIAVPVAFSAYARVGLTTLENLLVPRKLRQAGFSADSALSGYGAITGMVLPIIGFPSCLLSAVAELTVPELTGAQVRGETARIRRMVSRLLMLTLGYSTAVAAVLFFGAGALGRLIYHTDSIARQIRLFSLLVPVMYLDIVTDGCLKGLGDMLRSMSFNISEACIGVVLVIVLLPRFGLPGYVAVLFLCEIYNFTLSFHRLCRTAGLGVSRKNKAREYSK